MTTATYHAIPRVRMTRRGFRTLVGVQAKLLMREPGALIWLLLPVALVVLFGNIPAFQTVQQDLGGRRVIDVYVPTFAALTPLFLALAMLPPLTAALREKNALRRFAVSPVPPAGMLAALLAVVAALAAIGVLLIVLIGALAFHVHAPNGLGAVVSSFVLGSAAVLALGLVPASVAPTAGTASAIGVPLMILNFFFSGLYFPIAQMPQILRQIGEYVPFGAVMDAWSGYGPLWQHLVVLAGYTLAGSLVSAKLFRWE
jgi:ABC-2 type transport system permease protein